MGFCGEKLKGDTLYSQKIGTNTGEICHAAKNIYLVTLVLQLLGQIKEGPQQKVPSLKYSFKPVHALN